MDTNDTPDRPAPADTSTARAAALCGLPPEQFDGLKRGGEVPAAPFTELEAEVDPSIAGVQGADDGEA